MTLIYQCQLELQDNLYFATREMGRLYETEAILHNYALCYALGIVDSQIHSTVADPDYEYRYFCPEQVPQYEAHLSPLNKAGIYVTPARPLIHTAVLNTWKYANNNYHVEMEKTQKNIPSFGRAKEIAPESVFEFFILSKNTLTLPKWIRLGKWMSKAEVQVVRQADIHPSTTDQEFLFPHILNPLDVIFSHQVISYDVINMPPVSLIKNVRLRGSFYSFGDLRIPARMQYRFSG